MFYNRKSTQSASKGADAAHATAVLDGQRRHDEIAPRFKISVMPAGEHRRLEITLSGPAALGGLDGLTVTVCDDNPWVTEAGPRTPDYEDAPTQIWGPYRFTPATGPGADPALGFPGADSAGRNTPTRGMPVGETLVFLLESVTEPSWVSSTTVRPDWQREHGIALRQALACTKTGYEPWCLVAELDTRYGASVEV